MNLTDTEQRVSFTRKFATLAEANQNRFDRVRITDVDFTTDTETIDTAIHCERAWRGKFERLNIRGGYAFGVAIYFGLYSHLDNIAMQGPRVGFFVGDGTQVWDEARPNNSASNLSRLTQCRFGGTTSDDVGFHLYGGAGVVFDQCVVEGFHCGTAWKLFPRQARCVTTLRNCWLEVEAATAIQYDGLNGVLVIDGLDLAKQPELLLDAGLDEGSVVVFRNCAWKDIPPMKLSKTTKVVLEESNHLDRERFWSVVHEGRIE